MSCFSVIGDDSSLLEAIDPRREGLLLFEEISQEARSYDKIEVGDDMILYFFLCMMMVSVDSKSIVKAMGSGGSSSF